MGPSSFLDETHTFEGQVAAKAYRGSQAALWYEERERSRAAGGRERLFRRLRPHRPARHARRAA
ncbi:MAG: hypothetical protein ACE14W_00095 [Candidatus Velamenicoccus archaeovorus]